MILESDGTSKWYVRDFTALSDMLSVSALPFAVKTGSATFTLADVAKFLHLADASVQACVLPAANAVAPGQKIAVLNATAASGSTPIVHTLTRAGSDVIVGTSSAALTSLSFLSGNFAVLESDGISKWYVRQCCFDTGWMDAGANTVTAGGGNPTKGTGTTFDHLYWRRVGHNIEMQFCYRHTVAGSAGSGGYLWRIPLALAFDTAVLDSTRSVIGMGEAVATTDGDQPIIVIQNSTTQVACQSSTSFTAMQTIGSPQFHFGRTSCQWEFHARAPISGWAV